MTELGQAESELAVAEKAVADAESNLALVREHAASRKLEGLLKAAGHGFYELRRAGGFGHKGFEEIQRKFESLQDEFCCVAFGADGRLQKLHRLDSERWPLTGEYVPSLSGLTTDEDMAYGIATLIFDNGFGRGSEEAFGELSDADQARFKALRARAVECCGDAGAQGFKFWEQGRHDT